jgi:membrane-associated phospholipid phosphatase
MLKRNSIFVVSLALLLSPADVLAGKSGLETYGDVGQYAIPGVAAAISIWGEEGPDKVGLIQLGTSALVTVGIVQGLKHTIDRERPNGKNDRSFPSGHTSSAFSGASYLHYRYGWQYGTPAYLAASVVGYSRVEADKHFVSDVIAGAAIANVVAFFLVDSINEDVVIIPVFNSKKPNFGILAKFKF